ncbi:MAG: cytochrome c [Dehalococcoidia bacterium]|nr:cytochrome c [Dehalococcoidia bacterium]
MASRSSLTRFRPPLTLVLIALAASVLLVACDDEDDPNSSPTATQGMTSTPTAATTSTPSGGGAGASAYQDAYDGALEMALEEDLGSEVDDAYLATVNIDVRPDGEGLPDGSGIAETGAQVYVAQCATCHGDHGEGNGPGGNGPQLIVEPEVAQDGWQPGEPKVIGNYWPYATTVYDFINRAMPFLTPGTLSPDEVYAVSAFLLAENGVIEASEEMNAETLVQVEMPNRDAFFSCWAEACRPDVESGGGGASAEAGD